MLVFRNLSDLKSYLNRTDNDNSYGCLADTSFLYAMAYKDDRLFEAANDVHDVLVEYEIPLYTNVITRLEMIDLIFRKQVTLGCVKLFEEAKEHSYSKEIFNLLKDIRDKNSAFSKRDKSYKVDESRLKKLRSQIEGSYGIKDWTDFCHRFVGSMLINEWLAIEEDFGFNFVEVLEGQLSDLFESPLIWQDMVAVIGKHGLRGPDAMIVNMFSKSKFELLITSDKDFEQCFTAPFDENPSKAIFLL